MADNVAVTAGSGTAIAADEVTDGTLGSCKVQFVKLMDGTLDGTAKAAVSASGLKVDLGADNDVTVSGTVAISSGTVTTVSTVSAVTAVTTVSTVSTLTGGAIADDAADSGNPIKVGAVVKNFDGTDPSSASAEDDRANLIVDRNRRIYVNVTHPNFWSTNTNYSSAQTNTALVSAPGAGLRLFITDIILSTDADLSIRLVEDTGGTPATVLGPYYFSANGGLAKKFVTPRAITINKDLGVTSVGTSNHTITIHGFIAP